MKHDRLVNETTLTTYGVSRENALSSSNAERVADCSHNVSPSARNLLAPSDSISSALSPGRRSSYTISTPRLLATSSNRCFASTR